MAIPSSFVLVCEVREAGGVGREGCREEGREEGREGERWRERREKMRGYLCFSFLFFSCAAK